MDYIDIKGYKSIKELHLELKPINVLIGANGAGKSNYYSLTIYKIIYFCLISLQTTFSKYYPLALFPYLKIHILPLRFFYL